MSSIRREASKGVSLLEVWVRDLVRREERMRRLRMKIGTVMS